MEGRFLVKGNKDALNMALMERRMLTAENEMECCLNSTSQTGEHKNMSNACVCVPFPVIFVVSIILFSFLLFAGYP